MNVQSQIKKTLSTPSAIGTICDFLDKFSSLTRTELARRLCRHFDFIDARGIEQIGGCLKAIREIAGKGHFTLPQSTNQVRKKQPRRLEEGLASPRGLPEEVCEISELRLEPVVDETSMRIWNEMMIEDHPRGAGPLVGRQMRYLIISEHGYLGGFGFSSAALYLNDRDKWIG